MPQWKNQIMLEAKTIAKADAAIGLLFALYIPFGFWYTQYLVKQTIATYGRNVDTGAYFPQFAFVYLLPAAVLFFTASFAIFNKWQFRKVIHYTALAWVIVPTTLALVSALLHAVGA